MVQRRQRERSLFEVLLPDGHKLWPEWLRKIDTLLEDEAVIEVVVQALETRWPQSRRRGRPGTPADVVIRMLILKHLFRSMRRRLQRATWQRIGSSAAIADAADLSTWSIVLRPS
jgi:transposase, IS5 family